MESLGFLKREPVFEFWMYAYSLYGFKSLCLCICNVGLLYHPYCTWLREEWDGVQHVDSLLCVHVVVAVQSLSHVWLFATPWTATCQAPLSSFTISSSLLKFLSIELVMLSNHLLPPSPFAFNLSQHQGLFQELSLHIKCYVLCAHN